MAISKRFLPSIPKGHQIFETDVELAGVEHHRKSVISFVESEEQSIELEREPGNRADSNAIAVIGTSQSRSGRERKLIGYVPAEIALRVAITDVFSVLHPRLRRVWVSDSGFCVVGFDLTGPKSMIGAYRDGVAKGTGSDGNSNSPNKAAELGRRKERTGGAVEIRGDGRSGRRVNDQSPASDSTPVGVIVVVIVVAIVLALLR
jgi:hypothetical protein